LAWRDSISRLRQPARAMTSPSCMLADNASWKELVGVGSLP
jgi:hypothetical protein